MLAISRLNIICAGKIYHGQQDTSTMTLKQLRNSIGVIPQVPTLFAGTLRYNIDPTGLRHTDDEITSVLNAIGVRMHLGKNGLNMLIEEDGRNLSVGERQCVSLARACLLNATTYVLDEATANIDHDTDASIQKMLRDHSSFVNATTIVVAHRLSTIADVDLIVVMDNGVVVEAGKPQDLLADGRSAYSGMVCQMEAAAGETTAGKADAATASGNNKNTRYGGSEAPCDDPSPCEVSDRTGFRVATKLETSGIPGAGLGRFALENCISGQILRTQHVGSSNLLVFHSKEELLAAFPNPRDLAMLSDFAFCSKSVPDVVMLDSPPTMVNHASATQACGANTAFRFSGDVKEVIATQDIACGEEFLQDYRDIARLDWLETLLLNAGLQSARQLGVELG